MEYHSCLVKDTKMEDGKGTHHTALTLAEHLLNFISALLVRDKFGPEENTFSS